MAKSFRESPCYDFDDKLFAAPARVTGARDLGNLGANYVNRALRAMARRDETAPPIASIRLKR